MSLASSLAIKFTKSQSGACVDEITVCNVTKEDGTNENVDDIDLQAVFED